MKNLKTANSAIKLYRIIQNVTSSARRNQKWVCSERHHEQVSTRARVWNSERESMTVLRYHWHDSLLGLAIWAIFQFASLCLCSFSSWHICINSREYDTYRPHTLTHIDFNLFSMPPSQKSTEVLVRGTIYIPAKQIFRKSLILSFGLYPFP